MQGVIEIMPAFIPKQYKKEPITIRIDVDKLNKIDEKANTFNMSRSEFINQCIDYAMEHVQEPFSVKE